MNENNKARYLGKGAGREKQPDASNSTPDDPLLGCFNLRDKAGRPSSQSTIGEVGAGDE